MGFFEEEGLEVDKPTLIRGWSPLIEVVAALEAFPFKEWDKTIPTDPLIYRLYELVGGGTARR